jgi:amidase
VVTILDIALDRQGHTGVRPGRGVLGHLSHRHRVRCLEIADGMVVFSARLRFPVRPMVGVIGTAPAGDPVATLHPGPHGGNMDHNDVRIGARVHLPVAVPGALLALGDVHASMGDGEISVTALEICGEVRARVELVKGEAVGRPRIELDDCWITTGDGPGIAEAIRAAADEMATFLMRQHALTPEEAYMLLSIRGDMRVGQCADAAMVAATARVAMPKL